MATKSPPTPPPTASLPAPSPSPPDETGATSPRKSDIEMERARAEHLEHASYRLLLIDEVEAYRVDKRALPRALDRAVADLMRKGVETSSGGRVATDEDVRVGRLRQEIDSLARREMELRDATAKLLTEATKAVNQVGLAGDATPAETALSGAEVATAVALAAVVGLVASLENEMLLPVGALPAIDDDANDMRIADVLADSRALAGAPPGGDAAQAPLSPERATLVKRLVGGAGATMTDGKIVDVVANAFAVIDKLRPPNLLDLVAEHRLVRRWHEEAEAELRRLTSWKQGVGREQLEEQLIRHPAVVEFEEKWRVLVALDVSGRGNVTIVDIFDDHYPIMYQEFGPDLVQRLLPRYERRQDRYHVIDRRVPFNRYKASIASAVDDESELKKYPFKIESRPVAGSSSYDDEMAVWNAGFQSRLDEDRRIVRHFMNTPGRDIIELGEEVDPDTAQKRRDGRGGETVGRSGRTITHAWHDLLQRLANHWNVLEPLVTPTPRPPA